MSYVTTAGYSDPMRYTRRLRVHRARGMGDAGQIVGQAGGASAGVVTAAAAPAVATALGISASIAIPLVGAAFAGILMGVEAILHSGCGQTCVVTSQWANQAEPLLRQNCDTYFAQSPRTTSDQQSALNVFDAVWAGLVQRCSQAGLGTAGQNCIADRQSGACKWKQTGASPWPGGPAVGECWNWFSAYRDPISRDTGVVSDTTAAESAVSSLLSGSSSGSVLPLLLVAGLVVAGMAL